MQLVSINLNSSSRKLLSTAGLAMALSMSTFNSLGSAALAATPNLDICPEVEAATWEENEQECATVTINGKDLIVFRGEDADGSAEDRAEDVADKLKDLLKDGKLDASKLVPSFEGKEATIRVNGQTIIKFAVPASTDNSANASNSPANPAAPMDYSFRVVNALRCVLGAPQLPANFLKMVDSQGTDQAAVACLTKSVVPSVPADFSPNFSGHASWYGGKFHGRRTSNGETFDQDGMTAAHRTLPFGTKLLVMNRKTGASCVVEVNDRGPFVDDRIIDLSRGAATKLKMLSSGVAMVDCMVIDPNKKQEED